MEEKIINLLALIHQENEAIMSVLLRLAAYPEDYEKVHSDTISSWEEYYMSIINANINHSQAAEMTNGENINPESVQDVEENTI